MHEDFPRRCGFHVGRHRIQFETVRLAKRKDERVLERGRLQFEIELTTKPLAQSEAPGTHDSRSQRGMQHQVHVAGIVEKPLDHQLPGGRKAPQSLPGGIQVSDDLRDGRFMQPQGLQFFVRPCFTACREGGLHPRAQRGY